MSQGAFLYFFPGLERDKLTRQQVLGTWLTDVWRDELRSDAKFRAVTQHFVHTGPNGSSGVIACAANPKVHSDQPIGFYPDHQTWAEIIAPSPLWLGFDRRFRPGPDSLLRERPVSGYEVELCDCEIWQAPIVRKWDDDGSTTPNLPLTMGIAPSGDFTASVRADLAWAWQLACDLWDSRARNGLTNGQLLEGGIKFLGLNYRLGHHEAFALQLFDSDNLAKVIEAALDLPAIEAWCEAQDQKKTNPLTAAV